MGPGGVAAIQGAAGLIGQGISMIGQKKRNERAFTQQKELMDIQYGNQARLNKQGQELQLDMWNKTNAEAQMEHLKAAGLNPALMYGGSGAGGSTTGSQGGGSAAGGSAPGQPTMDMANLMLGFDAALKQAAARKTTAEAIDQEISNDVRKQVGRDADMAEASNRKDKAIYEGQYLYEALQGSETERPLTNNFLKSLDNTLAVQDVERRIAEETEETQKNKLAWELMNAKTDKYLKDAKIDLTREQERKIYHDIWQGYLNAGLKGIDTVIKGRLGDIGKGKRK